MSSIFPIMYRGGIMDAPFSIKSTSLKDGQFMPETFIYHGSGCHGQNVSPELEWQGAPAETKSFAVTCFDPDAPTGHGWWHWTVVNIPNDVHRLVEGASNSGKLPPGAIELTTDYEERGYAGPCPPKGKPHRYVFTVYALPAKNLDANPTDTAEKIKNELENQALAKASLTVKYQRQ